MFQSRFKCSHDENLETFGDGAHVPGRALNLPIVAFVATLKRASEFRKREALGGSWMLVHRSVISAASHAAASCAARHGPDARWRR